MSVNRSELPTTSRQFTQLLQQSILESSIVRGQEVNDEHLALFCAGEADKIPADARDLLLHQIATNPELGETVGELREAGWGEQDEPDRVSVILRITPYAWALAACLAIALGVWQAALPSRGVDSGSNKFASTADHSMPNAGDLVSGPTIGNDGLERSAGLNGSHAGGSAGPLLPPPLPVNVPSTESESSVPPPPPLPIAATPVPEGFDALQWGLTGSAALAALLTAPAWMWLSHHRRKRLMAP